MVVSVRLVVSVLLLIVVTIVTERQHLSPLYPSTQFIANLFSIDNTSDVSIPLGPKTTGDIYVTRVKSERAVYSIILRLLPYTQTPLTVREDTSYLLQLDKAYHLEQLSTEGSGINETTWNDFITVNQLGDPFPNTLKNTHNYVLMSQDAISSNEVYPYYIFSRIGFNETYTQAIVYLGIYDASFSAGGRLYYLERVNRQWKAISISADWVTE